MNQNKSVQEILAQAREEAMNSPARQNLLRLFDQGTFVETGVYVTRRGYHPNMDLSDSLEGVVTGYGAVNGALVYAFAQDESRMRGAIDENHAKKIEALYHLALSNGAPVVGIFNCCGASVFEGVSAMSAYGRILSSVTEASGAIPQIAIVDGPATGTLSAVVAMFDFVLETEKAALYVTAPSLSGKDERDVLGTHKGDFESCISYARQLVDKLPPVCDASACDDAQVGDDPNRPLHESAFSNGVKHLITTLLDNGSALEVNASEDHSAITLFGKLGGVSCGVVATDAQVNDGKLSAYDCRKIARFVRFCNAFDIPVVTLVDSKGIISKCENDTSLSSELARLAQAYASADIPFATVYVGSAIGSAYILLGSKAVGGDVVYALPTADIGLLSAASSVAFVKNDLVTSADKRAELEQEWNDEIASPLAAAAYGEVDDILVPAELRARLCSALYMMRGEGPAEKVGEIDTL